MSSKITCYSLSVFFCFFFAYFFNHFKLMSPLIFLTIKLINILITYRIRKQDHIKTINVAIVALFTCFIKYFFLNFVFFGRLYHSYYDLTIRISLLFVVTLFVLRIPFNFLQILFKNDVVRTFLWCGFGVSDAYSLNMITYNYINGNIPSNWIQHIIITIITGSIGPLNGLFDGLIQNNKSDILKYYNDVKFHAFIHIFLAILNLKVVDLKFFSSEDIPGIKGNKFLEKSYKLMNISFMLIFSGYKSVKLGSILIKKDSQKIEEKNKKEK